MYSTLKQLLFKRFNLSQRGEDEEGQLDKLNAAIFREVAEGGPSFAAYRYAVSKFLYDVDDERRQLGKEAYEGIEAGEDFCQLINKIRVTHKSFARESLDRTRAFLNESVESARYSYFESDDLNDVVKAPDSNSENEPLNLDDLVKKVTELLEELIKQNRVRKGDRLALKAEDYGVEYIDKREKNGLFWVIGGENELEDFREECLQMGAEFHFKKGGGRQTRPRDSWWTDWTSQS